MRVEVRGHEVEVTQAMREHVERRLRFALDRFRERIDGAYAALRDLNGAERRGVDKHCRIVIVLRSGGSVSAHARRADMYQAIDVAAGAVGRAMVRDARRRRQRSRFPPRPPSAAVLRFVESAS